MSDHGTDRTSRPCRDTHTDHPATTLIETLLKKTLLKKTPPMPVETLRVFDGDSFFFYLFSLSLTRKQQ